MAEMSDLLSMSGMLHLFSISGMQVNWLRRKGNLLLRRVGISVEMSRWTIEGLLLVYGCLTYWPIGVLRSLGSYYLKSCVQYFHLPLSRFDQLSMVGLVLLFANPLNIASLSFQLSFGLTMMIQLFSNHYHGFSELSAFKQQCLISVLCLLTVWPVLINMSHQWYPLQIVMGIFMAYVLTDILLSSLIITTIFIYTPIPFKYGLFQWLSAFLANIISYFQTHNIIAQFSWTTGHLSVFSVLLLMSGSLLYLYFFQKKPLLTLSSIITIYSYVIFLMPLLNNQARITVLYVGQGDAMLIQLPHSYDAWLIDTGGRMIWGDDENQVDAKEAKKHLLPALKAAGVHRLKGVIITHPDIDHMGNLVGLALEMPIETLYINEYTAKDTTFREMIRQLNEYQQSFTIKVIPPQKRIVLVPDHLAILTQKSEAIQYTESMSNSSSIVSDVTFHDNIILNLGDLTSDDERRLMPYFKTIKPTIIKLGHHGSNTSTSDELLEQLTPRIALISAGKNNRYGHPHPEVVEKLVLSNIPFISTHQNGAIKITISKRLTTIDYVR